MAATPIAKTMVISNRAPAPWVCVCGVRRTKHQFLEGPWQRESGQYLTANLTISRSMTRRTPEMPEVSWTAVDFCCGC